MSDSVLIIDDSATVRELIIRILKSFNLFAIYYEAEDGLEGFKMLLSRPTEIVLCDLEMPRIDGFKFISMLKSRSEIQDIPVIILTGKVDQEMKIKGLEQGACDYVTKPFDPGELVARVNVHLKIKHLQDDLKRTNELLLELSNTDHLTGLFNRRYLMDSLEKELQRCIRNLGTLSIIILDIDHFKKVNDTFGHQQGDLVLKTVARTLEKELRNYDIAARYGGEEFVAVLPEANPKEAIFVAERIRAAIQSINFSPEMSGHTITASLGVANFPCEDCNSVDEFIKLADDALYRAKTSGRNRVEWARVQQG
jgi:two-component system cell cycle response regulator